MENEVSGQLDRTPTQVPRRIASRAVLGLVIVFAIGIFIGRYLVPSSTGPQDPLQFVTVKEGERHVAFPTFWDAWDTLHSKFINQDQLTDENLFYGAVAGMVAAAGDPYTAFANPEETKQFEENLGGSFSGIGIEIGVRKGIITVIAPLDGSPAKTAGMIAGDSVIAIDQGLITADDSLDDVVSRIRGERGTEVVLTVVHPGASETTDITIIRDTIAIESVRLTITDGIGEVRITNFNGDTSKRFDATVQQMVDAGVRGIIVDVRGNPGGYLTAAVQIASRFIPRGEVVVTERGVEEQVYKAEGRPTLGGIPLVVLIDGGSASASEILAGALRDQLHVPIIGTQSFGKGSVQELVQLPDGSSLRVTIAKWYTPNGDTIDESGITPTQVVEQDQATPEDEQQLAAQAALRSIIDAQSAQ